MKDGNKIPLWPLYLADALMFLSVLAIALPNIILQKPLGIWQTVVLAVLVLAALGLMLIPFLMQYKEKEKQPVETPNTANEKYEELFKAVFSDLRTLRSKQIQHSDLITVAEKSLANFGHESSSQTEKLAEINKAVVELKNMILEAASAEGEVSANPETENAELEARLEKLERLAKETSEDLENFKNSFEEIDEDFSEDDSANALNSETDYAASDEDGLEAPKPTEEIDSAEQSEPDEAEASPSPSYGEVSIEDKPKAKNWEGLIDKALSNSQNSSTRDVVSRFIEKNKIAETAADDDEYSDFSDEDEILDEDIESPDFYENEEDNNSELADEYSDFQEEKIAPHFEEQSALFAEDETPIAQKPKRVKTGDTAILATSFPGIGNKLYIRGNGGGLSPDKGVPMQMVEIGKWQWKCETDGDINASIWLNDEKPSSLGELVLMQNETIEVDASFD